MSQETPGQKRPSVEIHQEELNAAETDFKPYLEAANIASDRTRSTLYVLVVAVVIVFTAYRQTIFPDWVNARLLKLQTAAACLKEKTETTAPCEPAIRYAKEFIYAGRGTELLYKQGFENDLKEQINIFLKLRTEAISLRLPFFGVAMDINDLGVIGGFFLASILYILHAWLYREGDNLKRAMRKAGTPGDPKQKEHLEHLLMTQVLASRKGKTIGVFVLLVGVLIVHGYVLRNDILTYRIGAALQGPGWALFETLLDGLFFVFVLILSVLCGYQQWKLDKSVDALIVQVDGSKV